MADCNRISATYDTSEMMEYLRLVGTLGEVTSYTDLFPILTLIALLSGEGLTSEGARFATDMRNKYFTVLVSRSTYPHPRGVEARVGVVAPWLSKRMLLWGLFSIFLPFYVFEYFLGSFL